MSLIRSRGNRSTEMRFIALLRSAGITGWRRNQALMGKPDFVFRKEKVAVFVDGCFWHACPKHATFPKTRRSFWLKKFGNNKARDHRVNRSLRKAGWRVLRIWEHELKQPGRCLKRLLLALLPNEFYSNFTRLAS